MDDNRLVLNYSPETHYRERTQTIAAEVASEPAPQAEFVYGCNHRPAMYGTVPNGYISIDNDTSVYAYGTVTYSEPLSRDKMTDYDLHPASMNTRRFAVRDSVNFCGDKCEVIAHLPLNGFMTIRFCDWTGEVKETDSDVSEWVEPTVTVASEPEAEADSPTILTDEMLDEIRSAGMADLEAMLAEDDETVSMVFAPVNRNPPYLVQYFTGTRWFDERYELSFKFALANAKRYPTWRIIRTSDGIVIAQSKIAPEIDNAPPSEDDDAYEVLHVAGEDGGYIVVDSEGQNLTQPTVIRGIADVLARKANTPATCECGELLTILEEQQRGFCVRCAYDYDKPTDSSEPAPQADSPTILTDEMLDEIRSAGMADLEAMMTEDDVEDKPLPDFVIRTEHGRSADEILKQLFPNTYNAFKTPTTPVKPSHSRPSRKRSTKPRNRANSRSSAFSSRNMAKVPMMERNTPLAAKWREKRNLANAVAMPQPTITGLELLQRAQLTLVPKLTRTLETRRRAA